MTWVINLYGGPGTGKSTIAAELFAWFKHKNYNVELVREYAKELCWQNIPIECQLEILAEQYKRQRILAGKVDIIITDAPILLSAVYGNDSHLPLKQWATCLYHDFNNYDVFLTRLKPFNPKGRYHTLEESIELDDLIHKTIDDLVGIDFTERADSIAARNIYRAFKDLYGHS